MTSAHDVSPSFTEQERLYGISELASELGITARAIRFYEAKGLLTPPRVNGGRVYTRRERARLKLILRAKSIGFSLAEVRQFLDLYGSRGEGRPQQVVFVAERSNTLIKELEQKQADVAATLEELKDIHRQCLRYLAENDVPFSPIDANLNGARGPKKARRSQSKD
ncbi:MAG: MerR family DNA-binding transcriptional regulator [Rhodomicrobium sp.]